MGIENSDSKISDSNQSVKNGYNGVRDGSPSGAMRGAGSSDGTSTSSVGGKIPSHFRLKIVLPNKVVYDGEVEFIKFASPDGELMMYPGHERYICSITPSKLEFKSKNGIDGIEIKEGFCKFQDNFCQIAVSEV